MQSMNDLMHHFLQDMYYAEKLGVKSMAKMVKAVENDELKQAIVAHREQTQTQVERLEQVFESIGKRPKGKSCAAMEGLVEEGEDAVEESEKGPVLDAALIACGQAIEHYEIARYGTMVAWAKQMGNTQAQKLLQEILDEEKANDVLMTEIAERVLNPEAAESGEEDDDEGDEGEDESPEEDPKAEAKPKRKAKK